MDTTHINNKGNTKIIAHRGVSGIERENTMSAFITAGNRTYFGIETDVHKTIDGKYIIFHDDNLERLCGINADIEKSEFDFLRNIPISDMDGKDTRIDLRMPSLQEYISICKKYDKVAILELKNKFTRNEIVEICNIIEDYEYLNNVIFISFCLDNLLFLREKYPDQKAQYLVNEMNEDILDILLKHKLDVDIYYKGIDKEYAKRCKNNGIEINCWTVNDERAAEKMISIGVDYITTNILE